MKKNKFIILIITSILLVTFFNCKTMKETKNDEKKEETKDFDIMFNEALSLTNHSKYQNSIDLLNKIAIKFEKENDLAILYNIGFNYYKLKSFIEAKKYLIRVINTFEESTYDEEEFSENRKFVILSETIIQKIAEYPETKKDPYRVKEDIEEFKKKKPRRPAK